MYSSRWFNVTEFKCHDGTPVPHEYVDTHLAALASQLDLIRDSWGSRVEVVSGYRTSEYNAAIKGAKNSLHVKAMAADIRPMVVRGGIRVRWHLLQREERKDIAERFYERVKQLMAVQSLPLVGGIGWYPSKWVHVDVRPKPADGHVARWEGEAIGSEATA